MSVVALGTLVAGALWVPAANAAPAVHGVSGPVVVAGAVERPARSHALVARNHPMRTAELVEVRQGPDRGPSKVAAPDVTAPAATGRSSLTAAVVAPTIRVNYAGFTPQAQAAFQSAVDVVASLVTSDVPIEIAARFEALPTGVLGSAGPGQLIPLDEPSGPVLYPSALANDLVGFDVDATPTSQGGYGAPAPEVDARFNSAFSSWYFGTDGRPPAGTFDFKSVVLHEVWHGLGFTGSLEVQDEGRGAQGLWYFSDLALDGPGTPTYDVPMAYDLSVVNAQSRRLLDTSLFANPSTALKAQLVGGALFFDGAFARRGAGGGSLPRLYAPSTWSPGSSYAHLDEATYPAGNRNSLMTYQIGPGEAIHTPGPISLGMFNDMGWRTKMVPAEPTSVLATAGSRSATVSWTAPADAGGTPVTGFEVVPYSGSTPGTVVSVSGATTSATVPGLTAGTPYTFRVRAINAIGTSPVSAASGPVTPIVDGASPIETKYAALGGAGGFLGALLAPEASVLTGRFSNYQNGSIYWSPATAAHEVRGPIRDGWNGAGGVRGPLGFPATDQLMASDTVGRYNHFEGGSVYWTPTTGAREVRGAIRDRWSASGAERSALGYPTSNESGTPDGRGRYNQFQTGSVYWSPATGAQEVRGLVRDRWQSLGWENGVLGYPTTSEAGTPDGRGRYNHFQGGSVYWTPSTGAQDIRGAIRDRWSALGWERSALGYPTTGESRTPNDVGRYNHFQSGSVYWSPGTGAQEVRGAIRDRWASLGWENGFLGFPVSSEYGVPGGRRNDFQGGSIVWDARTGGTTVFGR